MSSKRKLRRKMCDGKRKLDKITAIKTKHRLITQGERDIGYYKCKFCNQYHVGHYPSNIKKAMLKKAKRKRARDEFEKRNSGSISRL